MQKKNKCKGCKYSTNVTGGKYTLCDYILKKGRSRGCPVDNCDKYEKR